MSTCINSILKPHTKINFQYFSLHSYLQEVLWLTVRLFLQISRRPSGFISGLVQPLLWLILFGALFQNIPLDLLNRNNSYGAFLSCGIIVFTSFTGSLNAGLPLIFDREFGFLNRLLAAPIMSKHSIILGATLFIVCITMTQNLIIIICSLQFFDFYLNYSAVNSILLVLLMVTSSISSLSLSLAFILPGHIEFLAFILVINLPMLFSSTALAPMYFMPYWLQIIAKFNPLTYAIEAIRLIVFSCADNYEPYIAQLTDSRVDLPGILKLLITSTCISFLSTKIIISRRVE